MKTVSRVVNQEGGVSPELTERVTAAIEVLGYRPDNRARQLRSGSNITGTIGMVQNDVSNPFFASIFKGVEDVAASAGYLVLSASSGGDPERQNAIISTLISRRVDGLVVVPVGGDMRSLADEAKLGTPVVFVDMMPSQLVGDLVVSDHSGGAYKATTHLLDHGHTRIALLCDNPEFYSAGERRRGYLAAMQAARVEPDPALILMGVGTPEQAEAAAHGIMHHTNPPTAFFAANNFVSIGTVRALRKLGLANTVAVVCFDDVELADMLEPGLTVVPQNPHELGRRAAELLFRRLDGRTDSPEVVTLPVDLVERGSGEIPPRPAAVLPAP